MISRRTARSRPEQPTKTDSPGTVPGRRRPLGRPFCSSVATLAHTVLEVAMVLP